MVERINAGPRPTQNNMSAPLLVDRLQATVSSICSTYKKLDDENVSAGGEEGAIIINLVDEDIYRLLTVLREIFLTGFKEKSGLFVGGRPKQLLKLFHEITLKHQFQELLEVPSRVDGFFGEESAHLEAAWFMEALNDVALPQYIDIIRGNLELAMTYYDIGESLLFDEATVETIIDSIHTLEQVYFQLELQSYADFYRLQHLKAKNSSQSSLKMATFSSSEYENTPSVSQQLQSNTPSEKIYASANSNGDSMSLRNPSVPSVRSPLRASISNVEEEEAEDSGTDSVLISNDLMSERTKGTVSSTKDSFSTSSETDVTTLTSTLNRSSGYSFSQSHKQTILGLSLPFGIQRRTSILGKAMGALKLAESEELTTNKNMIPGDFELIDRIEEKERLRLTCSASLLETRICPIEGLDIQRFKCHGCGQTIGINDYPDAKLCEVSGFYFCGDCHVDDEAVSPALAVKNWFFRKVKVSRMMADLLSGLNRTELFNLEEINPDLFLYIEELQKCKILRFELVSALSKMKACQCDDKLDLIRQVWPREHLLETINLYSIEDLLEVQAGLMSRQLEDYNNRMVRHLKSGCKNCSPISP